MANNWWGNSTKNLLADCEARLAAALTENAKLREENEQLRKVARPPVMFTDDGGGEVTYETSFGGW